MRMCVQTMALSENMTRQLYNQLLFMVSRKKQLKSLFKCGTYKILFMSFK